MKSEKNNISQSILNDALKAQLKKRIEAVDREDKFLESVSGVFCIEKRQSDKNKNTYFRVETAILVLSGLVTLISAIGSGSGWSDTASTVFGILTAVISCGTTCLIGIKGLRQWQETWLRHRKCLNLFYVECYEYANCIGNYESYNAKQNDPEAEENVKEHERQMLQKFKTAVITILSENNSKFMANMKKNGEK